MNRAKYYTDQVLEQSLNDMSNEDEILPDYQDNSDEDPHYVPSTDEEEEIFSSGDEISLTQEGPAVQPHPELPLSNYDKENLDVSNNIPQITAEWHPPVEKQPILKQSGIDPKCSRNETGEYFEAVVDDRIFRMIADQTNLYATQTLLAINVGSSSRLHTWSPTNAYEIKKLFGMIVWVGLVKMPAVVDYWSQNPMFRNNFATSVMTRNRFEILLRMLHFADNTDYVEGDRLHKIKGLVDMLRVNFQSLYEPNEVVCVDESFRGYTYNLQIYAGKMLDQCKTTPLGVVMSLCEPILNQGRTICTDNWYTSLQLAERLLDRDTYLVGIMRSNRKGIPQDVAKAKLKVDETIAMENHKGVTVLNWRDKRNVLMLSTKYSNEVVETTRKTGQLVNKPKMVMDYNKGNSAVDLSDQMAAYSRPLRKTVKWYRKLAIELILNTSMVNAYVLYTEVTGNKNKIVEFRKKIVQYLYSKTEQERQV
ncbi:hypothetical protein NQ314_000811 [Rhamnusium bicolor]|uniref:PiggyBac transposable element-derived protein domain-containing protein n=1 Tax=Rhamnusium bicolor TaxID=1586634 RepID=A0AAV8ZUU5_9CUCU|nr:hypothetical protein NQ314_000811 [Rhamnusium bicolor]